MQEVFGVLIHKLPTFEYDAHRSFRSWLRAIAVNVWKNHCRKITRQPMLVAELDEWGKGEDSLSTEQHRQELVSQALVLLQPEFRPDQWRAFVEHGLYGRPAEEVATELGTTLGAVYTMKCRVLARVRDYLKGILDENE